MSAAAWAQLLVLLALLAISTPLLGSYMAKVYGGGQGARRPRLPPGRATRSTASAASTRRASSAGRRTRSRCSRSASCRVLVLYAQLRLQGHLPLNPDHQKGVEADALVQHRGQLPHEHELAELLGRVDDVAPHPDGRPRGAQLRVGRGRRGRRGRADPRPRPPAHAHARQLLGRPRLAPPLASCSRWRSCSRSCS